MIEESSITEDLRAHARSTGVVGAVLGIVAQSVDGPVTSVVCSGTDGTDPVGPDTAFPIASVTKPMVATVVMGLVADGLIALDDSIGKHVPELRTAAWSEDVTVRHLLANTGGIPLRSQIEWAFDGDDDTVLSRVATAAGADPAFFPAGRRWGYSNAGWCLLGRAIETATSRVWEDAMRERLFLPLGMTSTTFLHEGGRASQGYVDAQGAVTPVPNWCARGIGPGGGTVCSTVVDLLRFARAHLEPDVLGFDPAAMRAPEADVDIPPFASAWCLGWARFDWEGGPAWGWDGIGGGHRAILRILPQHGGALVLLANTSTGRALYRRAFPPLLRDLFGVAMQEPGPAPGPAPLSIEGTYGWPDLRFTVALADGGIEIEREGTRAVAPRIGPRSYLMDPSDPDSVITFPSEPEPALLYRLVWPMPRVETRGGV